VGDRAVFSFGPEQAFSAYFDPFNGPNQQKSIFESNLPISARELKTETNKI
jgi:hypothetical protein